MEEEACRFSDLSCPSSLRKNTRGASALTCAGQRNDVPKQHERSCFMSTSVRAVTSVQSALAAAAQEAAETLAETMQEAARGDQQAIRKLAREQASHPAPQVSAPATQPGVGDTVNVLA
jgi:hypothetical protein